jgi:hypothetical protein
MEEEMDECFLVYAERGQYSSYELCFLGSYTEEFDAKTEVERLQKKDGGTGSFDWYYSYKRVPHDHPILGFAGEEGIVP